MNEQQKEMAKDTKTEIQHILNGGTPRCFHCKKPFKKDEKQSGKTYSTWESDCECMKKIKMSIG
uniref:Uncharacterized protein n=1 Tax=viral metagenome TaxID=1070528 RepID=A0A6C0EMI2_9ZZZZ